MAFGDVTIFRGAAYSMARDVNIGRGSGWKAALTTATFGALTAGLAEPKVGTAPLLEVTAGGNYPAGGIVLATVTAVASDAASRGAIDLLLDVDTHTDGILTVLQNAANPEAVRSMIIYDSCASARDAVLVIDVTEDGATAANLRFRSFYLTINPSGTRGIFITQTVS